MRTILSSAIPPRIQALRIEPVLRSKDAHRLARTPECRERGAGFLLCPAGAVGLIGLEKKFTPRGMRRTFNDLARVANVEALVTRSISGHLTEQMREHYSTVSPVEQRESIGRVLRLVQSGTSDGALPEGTGDCGTQRGSSGTHSRLGVR